MFSDSLIQKESISVVQTQIDKQRIDYEEQQKEIQTKKVDAIHQKNYIINQLKDENWKLIGKVRKLKILSEHMWYLKGKIEE